MNSYSSDIRPTVLKFTDHNSISLKLKLFKGNKGNGYWKLNTSILENQEYCKSIEKLITKYQHKFKEQTKLDILWDNFKLEVRDKTIDHCKKLANSKKNEIKKLENELKYLEELSNTSTYKEDTSLKQKLEITIKRLDKLYTEKTKGRQIRSRVKWIKEGEKNTTFFLGLEKTRQTKKAINELYDKNGKSTTDQNEIMEIEVDYYKKLYKSTNPDNDKLKKYIENTKVHNKLSNNESEKCEGEITIEECTNAIFKMKLNKAPGLDGLSVEFYRKFWNNLKKLVTKIREGSFPLPSRQFLNINIPSNKQEAAMKVTYAGYRHYANDSHLHRNPRGEEFHWLGLHPLDFSSRKGKSGMTDFDAIKSGYISITPIMLDLSAYKSMQTLEEWL